MREPIGNLKYIVALALQFSWALMGLAQDQEKSRFSVKDDIELTQFGDVYFWIRGDVAWSPSREKILVHTVRASLEDGAIHDELRVYLVPQLRDFVRAPNAIDRVEPVWKIELAKAGVGGPLLSNLRWLDDEKGIAFLLRTGAHHRQLCLAKLGAQDIKHLTQEQEDVLAFAIRDPSHYVFTVASLATRERVLGALDAPVEVGTGRSFWDLISPGREADSVNRGDLWAANGGPPAPLRDAATGNSISVYEAGNQNLSLSPDGTRLITVLPLSNVPKQWESLYPPPYPGDAIRIRAGGQDLEANDGLFYIGQYVLINLKSGVITSLANAPAAAAAGWLESGPAPPAWSDDGTRVLLPGTFLARRSGPDARPCLAEIEIETPNSACVRPMKRDLAEGFEAGYEQTDEVQFARGTSDEVIVKSSNHSGEGPSVNRYLRSLDGEWKPDARTAGETGEDSLEVRVEATFKDPPVLVATDPFTKKSRAIFDPNPKLKAIEVGEPALWNWEDRAGRNWKGILFKPVGYRPGVKYPLVIQNHGFSEDRYTPSGGFPSAFVAEELASADIMVLQVRDCAGRATPIEGPCNVEGYEAAIEKLSRDGLIDPSRIGIIGFSRTVFYVLEALTTSRIHFRAASITDGINVGYMDYMHSVGPSDGYRREAEAIIGAPPFGAGLLDWMKEAPLFNMDKVSTPLRVVATRGGSLIEMWEPYALLEAMHMPVDLIVLNTVEHVITDPKIREAAQSGNVDWFRFWLEDYEDPDPAKTEQYARWRELRKLDGTQ